MILNILKKIYSFVISTYLAGNKFECPCCGGTFRELLPAGDPPRENARCPRCGSLERHRLLWLYLKNKTSFFTDRLTVLDIAPMDSLQKKFKKLPNLNYLSVDLESPLAMVKMNIMAIPAKDNTFDGIICYHVLEHIPDDQGAMRELLRVLKPGGWGILQSPIDDTRDKTYEDPAITSPADRKHHFGQDDHVRIYGRDYEKRLQNTGFIVKKERYQDELGQSLVRKYNATDDKELFLCLKPGTGSI